ncbi:MAG: alpha-E domain-containing protein [Actinomycetia bacterium]|nr:alpha-E domain-containing protein [Actinomycetes bacterium]
MILARHAEALFWAGRQLDRAETTARALNVTSQNLMHLPPGRAHNEWMALLTAVGLAESFAEADQPPTSAEVAHFLFADADNPGSVVAAVFQLRENIRTVRDRVPVELWEESNRLHLAMTAAEAQRALEGEPFELFASVRRGCQAISGVVAEAMPRDEGYTFLVLGRMIERALTTTRLLRHSWDRSPTDFDAAALLRTVSALQAFRRVEGYETDRVRLNRFLLRADAVPRSVFSCLNRAEARLSTLADAAPGLDSSRLLCGRLRSLLEFGDLGEALGEDAPGFLLQLEADLLQLAEVIAGHSFNPAHGPSLHSQFVRPEAASR